MPNFKEYFSKLITDLNYRKFEYDFIYKMLDERFF